jgi:hypothetical protein
MHAVPPAKADGETSSGFADSSAWDDAADRFLAYETSRIESFVKASENVGDEELRSKVYETAIERSQVLQNLRVIIDGAGTKSRLAQLARDATTSTGSSELVSRLFGPLVLKHWEAAEPRDVVIAFPQRLAADPIAVLRDTTGRFTREEKQTALYLVLSRDRLTAKQETWLTSVVESLASSDEVKP